MAVADSAAIGPDLKVLAGHLEALASEARLALLQQLRTPKELHEIRLQAARSRAGEASDRPLARQSVSHHLEQLEQAGLLYRMGAKRGERFALNHQRLFALVTELRSLTRLRPELLQVPPEGTLLGPPEAGQNRSPGGPRLAVVYGWQDGLNFSLDGPPGTRWRLGRSPSCDIALDHDPYLSSENSVVERVADGHLLHDRADNRNGTFVNWVRLIPGSSARLEPGDVVGVGRTLLVFKP